MVSNLTAVCSSPTTRTFADLAVTVQPKSGAKTYKAIYYVAGFPRWFHIGNADTIGLADARKMAARVLLQAAEGKDPVASGGPRGAGALFKNWRAYVEQYAKKKNKSLGAARQIGRAAT